jgi:hypothetical protein
MAGAPNSANTNLSCCAALMPPKKPGEYDTIADGANVWKNGGDKRLFQ